MADRLTVYDEGGAGVTLTMADHLATGGEGSVYSKAGRVYKVYLDPAKAVRAGMEKKVAELARLRHPGIAAPEGLLRNKKGEFVGLTLPLVAGDALCRAFTNGWRDQNQFGPAETAKVVEAMRSVTGHAHQHRALMVDANEMNWLLAGSQPVAIDVDSWQLPGFPATAIMPSIRDYSQNAFSEGTDWFAWAVVTFQLWTGIHPYKGTHPDFNRGALEPRMKAMASVFDPKVRLPGAARPVSEVPAALRNWYERTFQSAERSAPPSAFASALATQTAPRLKVVQTLAGSLKQERLVGVAGKVLAAFNGFVVAKTGATLQLWDAAARAPLPAVQETDLTALLRQQAAVLRLGFGRVLVKLDQAAGVARAKVLESGAEAVLACRAERFWQSGNRLFAIIAGVSNGLVELDVAQLGDRLALSVRHQWPVAALSTQLMRGVFVQDCLGAPFVGVLEGEGLIQAASPELKGYRLAEGFGVGAQNIWLTGVRVADGQTVRLQLALKVDKFKVVDEQVVDQLTLDAAATASGVCVLRDGADLLVAKGAAQKRLENSGLSEDLRLFSLGPAGIGGFADSELSRISLA